MISKEVFTDTMNKIITAYQYNMTPERFQIYYDALKHDYTDTDIEKMLPILLQTCKFFPTIAHIVEAINDIDYLAEL